MLKIVLNVGGVKARKMKIQVEFGKINVDGKKFHDAIILPSGKILEREYEKIKEKYGTGHVIDDKEIELVLKEKPEIIVIGTGFDGKAELTKEAKENILKENIKLIELKTPKAVEKFLSLKDKKAVAGIFHSTC